MCDLGASINLKPFLFWKIRFGKTEVKIVSLQLVDRSIKHFQRIVEDILIKVIKFIFLANFINLIYLESLHSDLEKNQGMYSVVGGKRPI